MYNLFKRRLLNSVAYYISYFKLMPLLKHVNEDSLIIDCGANKGDISAIFLKKNARVIAFEPDPLAYMILHNRFKDDNRIECINEAVSHKAGWTDFFFHQDRALYNDAALTVSSSLIADKVNVDSNNSIKTKTVDLDDYINSLDQDIHILKLDVEGAEIDILHRLIENGTYKKVNLILVETHESKIPGHDELVSILKRKIEQENINNIKLNWI